MGTVNYKPIAAAAARAAAKKYGLNPDQFSRIILRQVNQESGFNPNARSNAGAVGISQIVPHWHPEVDAHDPRASLNWQANYMAKLVRKEGWANALSIYNSGRKNVYKDPHFSGGQTYNYVRNILSGSDVSEASGGPVPSRRARRPVGGLTEPSSGTSGLDQIMASLQGGSSDPKQAIVQSIINGDNLDAGSLIGMAQQRQQAQAATDTYGPQTGGGYGLHDKVQIETPNVSPNAGHAISLAKKYLGEKYKWGGSNPTTGFDCSGFVQWVAAQQGIKVPRTTYEQIKVGKPVDQHHLQPGDSVFFSKSGDVHHEGMYIGHGQFIHAPHTGDVIKISSLADPYYQQQFAGGRRIY